VLGALYTSQFVHPDKAQGQADRRDHGGAAERRARLLAGLWLAPSLERAPRPGLLLMSSVPSPCSRALLLAAAAGVLRRASPPAAMICLLPRALRRWPMRLTVGPRSPGVFGGDFRWLLQTRRSALRPAQRSWSAWRWASPVIPIIFTISEDGGPSS
jgi:ABC-type uncharacterized transport system permease subunit